MRKPDFHLCENKDADQLCSNYKADQRLCYCYTDSIIYFLNTKFQASSLFSVAVSDLIGNPKDRFSHVAAHLARTFYLEDLT